VTVEVHVAVIRRPFGGAPLFSRLMGGEFTNTPEAELFAAEDAGWPPGSSRRGPST